MASNPNLSPSLFWDLARNDSTTVRLTLARNPHAPPDVVAFLVDDDHGWARDFAAANINCPPGILARLASDPDLMMRTTVAAHPNTPEVILDALAVDCEQTRRFIGFNPRAPLHLLEEFAAEDYMRDCVWQNSATPEWLRIQLLPYMASTEQMAALFT